MKVGNDEAVEIREVVVDPQLPRLSISSEIPRQPLHRVDEARRADLGVSRGVAHRSARRVGECLVGRHASGRAVK
eukprot:scaffold13196_cov117-Isochrysis_galbana.AAC.6